MRYLVLIALLACMLLGAGIAAAQDDGSGDNGEAEAIAEDVVQFTESTAESTATAAEDFFNRLLTRPENTIVQVLLVIGGIVLLLIGWQLYEFIILLTGILIGAAVGVSAVPEGETVLQIAGLLVGGVIGAALAIFLYYVAVFFVGAYVGIVMTGTAAAALNLTPVSALALLVGGVIGGIILLALSVELLAIISAIVGAQMIALGLDLGAEWMLLLAIVGIVAQIVIARSTGQSIRRRPKRRFLLRRL